MGWEGERSLTAHFAGSRLCHSRFTPVPYVPFPSHPVPSRLGPFPSVPYPGPDGTGRDEMGRECSDNQIITIIVQFFPAVTNDFLFHSPHVPVPLRHSPFVSRSVGSLMSFTSFPRPSGRDRRERNEGREGACLSGPFATLHSRSFHAPSHILLLSLHPRPSGSVPEEDVTVGS